MQPIASEEVAAALADLAVAEPFNGTIELAGPEKIRMDETGPTVCSASGDARQVTTDAQARYFGIEVNDQSLTPGDHPHRADTLRRLVGPLGAGNAGTHRARRGTSGESLGGKSANKTGF